MPLWWASGYKFLRSSREMSNYCFFAACEQSVLTLLPLNVQGTETNGKRKIEKEPIFFMIKVFYKNKIKTFSGWKSRKKGNKTQSQPKI